MIGWVRDIRAVEGSTLITVEVKEPVEDLGEVEIAKHRRKRSLDANAYFHVLVTKIAEVLKTDNATVKNDLIRRYGFYEYVGDKIPTYLIKSRFEKDILSRELIHFNVIGRQYIDGEEYIKAALMRGSHTYDTKEMSRLIEGTVDEAKRLGIETLTPEELRRLGV